MSEIVQVNFRMPKELKDKLEQSAKESGRSITSELVNLLEEALAKKSQFQPAEQELQQQVKSLSEQLDEMMNITTNMYKAYYFAVESNPNIPFEQKQQLTEPKNLDLSKKAP